MERRDRKVYDDLAKKLIDEGRLMEAGWQAMLWLFPEEVTDAQKHDMRMAFFMGAQHLYSTIMSSLDEEPDATPNDMRRMRLIHEELDAFSIEIDGGQNPVVDA